MPSIEDLKKMPTTGGEIVIGAGAPDDEEETVVNPNVRPNNVRINMGGNRNNQPNVQVKPRPKTIIGQQRPDMVANNAPVASAPSERQELDLSTLPLSEVDQAYQDNIKESPMDDISAMVDTYLDEKEEEIMDAYAEVAHNIEEANAEKELDDSAEAVLDDTDDDDDFTLDSLSGKSTSNSDDEDEGKVANDSIFDDENFGLNDYTDDEEDLNADDNDSDDAGIDSVASTIKEISDEDMENKKKDDVDENDVDSVDEEATVDRDAYLKRLKALATEKLKPAAKALNLNSFTVVKKPTTNINFLKSNAVNVSKWVLPNQGSIVMMREYLGIELESLRRFSEDGSSPTSLTRKFKSIYDHIESPKPGTFEAWLKCTPYSDIDHYFFGVFIASYQGTNFIPYDCKNQECKNTFLTDDVKIMSMVKFKDADAENKFKKIYREEEVSSTKEGIYVSELVPISDRIAIAFKEPSIYNVIENNSIDGAFRRKYANIINFIPYIDSIYMIDQAGGNLIPIGYKVYENNATKTFKSKVQKYNSVFMSLTNDEFTLVQSYVSSVISREQLFTYQYPEVECPECHHKIEAAPTDAESAVFTRYQLGALVNTTLN